MKNRSIYFALLLTLSGAYFEPSLAMQFSSQKVKELHESTPDRNLIGQLLKALQSKNVNEEKIILYRKSIADTYNNLPDSAKEYLEKDLEDQKFYQLCTILAEEAGEGHQ